MNAVARVAVSDNAFIDRLSFNFHLPVPKLRILILIFLILVSALGVVYVKDLNRRLFITYQKLQLQGEQLRSDGNKLLLEQSALGAQARVQMVAQGQLQMQIPPSTDVMMIKV